jgi:hypothetical protein
MGQVDALRGIPRKPEPDFQNSRWPVAEATSNTNRPGTTLGGLRDSGFGLRHQRRFLIPNPESRNPDPLSAPENSFFLPANRGRFNSNR